MNLYEVVMRFFLLFALSVTFSQAFASDFYFRCQHGDKKIELDFNLVRGTWLSVRGLSQYWTHLMLMEVHGDELIFEVKEAGQGEADYLRISVPSGFLKGLESGEVIISSIVSDSESLNFQCLRDQSQED